MTALRKKTARMDAADTAFVSRELEFVRARSYDVKYPNFLARQLIPVDNSVDTGAETVKYDQYDMTGVAVLLSSYAQDLPRADVKKKEFRAAVKGMGISYGYNLQEIRAAQMRGMPLEQRKANAARRGFEQLVDSIGALGDTENGLQGLLSITNANTVNPVAKAAGGNHWSVATGLEMLKDLQNLSNYAPEQTRMVEVQDTVILPIAQYDLASMTTLFTSGETRTVLEHFLRTSPYIKQVIPWYRCSGAGSGATDRAMAYRRDADALQLVIPQEFEQLPFERNGLEFTVPCHGRISGVQCYYPLSVTYMDGI